MKIETYKEPKSSFLAVSKDMSIITDLIFKNNNLKKLLYYTTPDCLNKPNLSEDQTLELIGKNIKISSKVYIEPSVLNRLFIRFDGFSSSGNPEFRTNVIEFDIVCHNDQIVLRDFDQRTYRIAAEIDSMLMNQRLTGIGRTEFMTGVNVVFNDEFQGFCMKYRVYHGEEDKKFMPNPNNEQQMIDNFNEIFNS